MDDNNLDIMCLSKRVFNLYNNSDFFVDINKLKNQNYVFKGKNITIYYNDLL